jgi:hypothetical protein
MKLVFVYNADAGLVAALMDAVHKLASPETYSCSLCAITYGAVSMKPEWKAWLKTLPYPAAFYHRQDFARDYPAIVSDLPAVLLERGQGLETVLTSAELNGLDGVNSLISQLSARLKHMDALG